MEISGQNDHGVMQMNAKELWQRVQHREDTVNLDKVWLELEQAREEWILAERYFQSVSDPDLVDHATYLCLATERRYRYLLLRCRQAGIRRQLSS